MGLEYVVLIWHTEDSFSLYLFPYIFNQLQIFLFTFRNVYFSLPLVSHTFFIHKLDHSPK